MLKIGFDASNRDHKREFHVLYYSVAQGVPDQKERRETDFRERQAAVLEKLLAISATDPAIDPEKIPWDAPEPRVLVTGDLLLSNAERDMCREFVANAGWPGHLSAAWLSLRRRLAEAETVSDAKPVAAAT